MADAIDVTEAGLEELMRLREAATAGEWEVYCDHFVGDETSGGINAVDAAKATLIAAAVNAIGPLCEEVKALRGKVGVYREWKATFAEPAITERDDLRSKLSAAEAAIRVEKAAAAKTLELIDAASRARDDFQLAHDAATEQIEVLISELHEAGRARDEAREALRTLRDGMRDHSARGMGESLPVEFEMPVTTNKRVRALIDAALATKPDGGRP